MKVTLLTSHCKPPIPSRCFDWCAYPEGQEETATYGWGKTEVAAIQDWKDQFGEYERVKPKAVKKDETKKSGPELSDAQKIDHLETLLYKQELATQILLDAAGDLDAAMDGATSEFNAELRELGKAMKQAVHLMRKKQGESK